MKRVVIVLAALLCIGAVCGGFYYVANKQNDVEEVELTEVQKLLTKDLEKNYPSTPREVIKLYNRILMSYYADEYTEEELEGLMDQMLVLFDEELKQNNPRDQYLLSLKADIAQYKQAKKLISQSSVCDSDKIKYMTDGGDELAYVTASYFVRKDTDFSRTYQEYVLRKDSNGDWKILCFYKIDNSSVED